ncbi:phosphoglycerate dehydrogenase [Vibrio sinaloensis]|uniref:phosphoglycerate dehydrogenase n=1 Tax=Photobacterium sp. (strain ATCC 43367) TaxID=379097 RepID=UPI002045F164|nr:phosphoglycerate dehydrogenase [Vibrio sinaloensis]UPQ88112.1 phosphoglycerate dehydrogenase [Vibrio sinaloensis]
MKNKTLIGVTSRSFSANSALRKTLLERYENVKFNDAGERLSGKSLVDFLAGCEKAITALEPINEETLSQLPDLKVLSKYGVGIDMIDLSALKKHGVRFGWTKGVNKRAVSELALTFAITLLRKIDQSTRDVKAGVWTQTQGRLLSGKTVGVIGCGNIGQDLIKLLVPFGCNVLAYDIENDEEFYSKHQVTATHLDTLLQESDVVTLHVPLDETTRNMISSDELSMMKEGSILLNTARGGVVDEVALLAALKDKSIGAAGFDVLCVEPPVDNPLVALDNFYITSHIGGGATEAILAMGMAAIDGLDNNNLLD